MSAFDPDPGQSVTLPEAPYLHLFVPRGAVELHDLTGVQGEQLLVDAELERQEAGAEHLGVELEQALEHGESGPL